MSDARRLGPILTPLVAISASELCASGCAGKERFATFTLADQVAKRGTRQRMRRQPYRCSLCQGFHLGTPSLGSKKKQQVRR